MYQQWTTKAPKFGGEETVERERREAADLERGGAEEMGLMKGVGRGGGGRESTGRLWREKGWLYSVYVQIVIKRGVHHRTIEFHMTLRHRWFCNFVSYIETPFSPKEGL